MLHFVTLGHTEKARLQFLQEVDILWSQVKGLEVGTPLCTSTAPSSHEDHHHFSNNHRPPTP